MLFTVAYTTQGSQTLTQLLLSGSNISSVIVYCDSNNIIPKTISQTNSNLIVVNSNSNESYQIILEDESGQNSNQTILYGTFNDVINWVSTQTGFVVKSLSKLERNLVIA